MESMQSLCQELSTMLSQTEVTPDIVEKFKAGSQKLKANPGLLDDLIGKLSPAAQAPAKKFRNLMLQDDMEPGKFQTAGKAIKDGLPSAVQKELDGFKFDFGDALGLW
ncbi:hypothetical protein PRIPAC_80034 [Pristionchus pacificus]|uniref:Uncharacterized protein n=1 Tax=Pristionchus pacificus TaxID=54126 RepID=A0A2A6CQ68_PRIPA|nr:hypothetical protein PRIPAC_80034 [Pristionchus pacificus]|eukprot:PDM80362.1 hypothetical protein PRIPAC_32941 [Pristionchus pacificus]